MNVIQFIGLVIAGILGLFFIILVCVYTYCPVEKHIHGSTGPYGSLPEDDECRF